MGSRSPGRQSLLESVRFVPYLRIWGTKAGWASVQSDRTEVEAHTHICAKRHAVACIGG